MMPRYELYLLPVGMFLPLRAVDHKFQIQHIPVHQHRGMRQKSDWWPTPPPHYSPNNLQNKIKKAIRPIIETSLVEELII